MPLHEEKIKSHSQVQEKQVVGTFRFCFIEIVYVILSIHFFAALSIPSK